MNKRLKWFRLIVAATAILSLAVFAGCESPLDPDTDNDNGTTQGDPGTLTVSVEGMDDSNDLNLRVAVVESGEDPKHDRVAVGLDPIDGGSAEVTVTEMTAGGHPTDDIWNGVGGDAYDVHIWAVHVDNGNPDMSAEGNLQYKNAPYTYTQDGDEVVERGLNSFGGIVGISASGIDGPPEGTPAGSEYYFSAWLYVAGAVDLRPLMISEGDFDDYSDKEWVGDLGVSYDLYLQIDGPHDNPDGPLYWWTEDPIEIIELDGLTLISYEYEEVDWELWED